MGGIHESEVLIKAYQTVSDRTKAIHEVLDVLIGVSYRPQNGEYVRLSGPCFES